MKQLIKAASIYKAEVPSAKALEAHLAEKAFAEMSDLSIRAVGFVPPSEGGFVTEFPGGLAFRVRIDEKIIPTSAVQKEVSKRADHLQNLTGRKPGKKERAEIKDQVLCDFARTAFTRTTAVTCFYERETGFLIVPTISTKVAGIVTSALVGAVGSVKTETINVSSVKHGLTTRMKNWLANSDDDSIFGRFHPCGEAALSQDTRRVTVKMGNLQTAQSGLHEALTAGFEVDSLGFSIDGKNEFKLTKDFRLKGITLEAPPTEDDDLFAAEAALEVRAISEIVTELCNLLGYQEEETTEPSASDEDVPADPAVVFGEGEDPLIEKAYTVIVANNKASISLVQRHLKVGYNRAARLLEALEKRGVVSPMTSNGTREILQAKEGGAA